MQRDKTVRNLDLNARKNNVIFDKLNEIEGENITERLNSMFDTALNQVDRDKVCIKKAYRLGKRPIGNIPRKVLVELGSSEVLLRRVIMGVYSI